MKLNEKQIPAPNNIPRNTQEEIATELGWDEDEDPELTGDTLVDGYDGKTKFVDVLKQDWLLVTGLLMDEDGKWNNWRPNLLCPEFKGKCLLRVTLLHEPTGVEVVLGQELLNGV